LRELYRADERDDVELEMPAIVNQGGALEPGEIATVEPEPACFGEGDGLAVGNMQAGAHLASDGKLKDLGVTSAPEGFESALAAAVGVVDDPGFAPRAVGTLPDSSTD
jgi:hypothetical protein